MTVETEISTPVMEEMEDTSVNVEPETQDVEDTSIAEPETIPAAETETEAVIEEPRMYAGKYKTVEDLEKGYDEAQKSVAKATEFEKKYNELLSRQKMETERIVQERLREAQSQGYRSAEEQELDMQLKAVEYQLYANNLNSIVSPEYIQDVSNLLTQYYATGHRAYLDEAKRYYSSDFIEQAARTKASYHQQLVNNYNAQRQAKIEEEESQLAEILKAEFADFLADIQTNEAKALALKTFCNTGSITSKEDMQVFHDIYTQIAKHEREQAIKELEAQKVIEEAKNKAVIDAGSQATGEIGGLKESYTQAEVDAMTQAEFDTLYGKHKDKFLQRIK
jgi:hypothetical protein